MFRHRVNRFHNISSMSGQTRSKHLIRWTKLFVCVQQSCLLLQHYRFHCWILWNVSTCQKPSNMFGPTCFCPDNMWHHMLFLLGVCNAFSVLNCLGPFPTSANPLARKVANLIYEFRWRYCDHHGFPWNVIGKRIIWRYWKTDYSVVVMISFNIVGIFEHHWNLIPMNLLGIRTITWVAWIFNNFVWTLSENYGCLFMLVEPGISELGIVFNTWRY